MRKQIVFLLSSMISLSSCSVPLSENRKPGAIDSTKSFFIGKEKVVPNKNFECNTLLRYENDTLAIATCSEYIYFPFGTIKNASELRLSLLTKFNVTVKKTNMDLACQILTLNSNKLILFFDDDPEATKSSYIIKGEIYDNSVVCVNGVQVGMTIDNFYRTFFSSFPEKFKKIYKVVVFESCVSGIRHIYTFGENKLMSIRYECVDCNWNID